MTQFTEVIRDDQNATIAYIRPPKLTWREQAEQYIERVRDWYDTLWDWMPAITSFTFLLWLITTFHK